MARVLINAAASVGASSALAPVLAPLFAGLDSLGSDPAQVVLMLRQAGIGPGHRVLDLGCGKGAAAVAAARKLHCRCLGVDAVPDFIASARRLAHRRGVAERCAFRCADIAHIEGTHRYDAAVMLGLFDVRRGARVLRRHVKPAGCFIIDDAVVVSRRSRQRGWLSLPDAREAILRRGDALLAEFVWARPRVRNHETALYAALERNAAALARMYPHLNAELKTFLTRQRAAARLLSGPLRPVQWLIRLRR